MEKLRMCDQCITEDKLPHYCVERTENSFAIVYPNEKKEVVIDQPLESCKSRTRTFKLADLEPVRQPVAAGYGEGYNYYDLWVKPYSVMVDKYMDMMKKSMEIWRMPVWQPTGGWGKN